MAPVLPDGRVQVRIAGIVCTLQVVGAPEAGWAILKPLSLQRARVVDRPSLRQVRDYLALFPLFRLLLLTRTGEEGRWLALPAHQSDSRLQTEGPIELELATGVEPFQQVLARFDGGRFWFQEVDHAAKSELCIPVQCRLVDHSICPWIFTVNAVTNPTFHPAPILIPQ